MHSREWCAKSVDIYIQYMQYCTVQYTVQHTVRYSTVLASLGYEYSTVQRAAAFYLEPPFGTGYCILYYSTHSRSRK